MKNTSKLSALLGATLLAGAPVHAAKSDVIAEMDAGRAPYEELALQIWDYAELGYLETKSSGALQDTLAAAGFSVEAGVAGMPTGFVASYGSGSPVIGILAEFDALPGVSQTATPEREVREDSTAGHACGHHLFGAGSVEAAIAVKDWLASNGRSGTIRLYGTPAEEGGSGKVYMVREGLFDDVDVALHWHAGDRNLVTNTPSLANKSGKIRFHGIASHAAGAPERGRSALDAVEALNYMMNMMREHVPDSTRIHYVITRGGEAPNVVPAFAEVYYYVRSPDRNVVMDVWSRLEKAAEGAALGTGTTWDFELTGGVYDLLPNDTLAKVAHENMVLVGGVDYDETEQAFAAKLGRSLPGGRHAALELATDILPFDYVRTGGGSTDVGDVSWTVPTIGVRTATWVPGTAAHSWQAVAAGGTTIGLKGMQVAAKTLALTAMDLFEDPALIAAAKAEFEERRGASFDYQSMLGDRPPALDYRK
ncbi:amidohydrolase [Actomonas aquatica]